MPTFQEFAKNTLEQTIFTEIDKKKQESGDNFNWQSYFVNFHHYLPHGLVYDKLAKEQNQNTKFGETGKTIAEFLSDVNTSIKESGVNFETVLLLRDQATEKYRECVRLVMTGKGESMEAKRLEQEHKNLHAQFYKALIPLYVALRSKGYRHLDIVT